MSASPMTNNILIEPARPTDGDDIVALTAATRVFLPDEVDIILELWNDFLTKGPQVSGYHFLVARQNERVAGYTCYGPRPMTDGTYDLYWIAVDPKFQRNGISKALLASTEAELIRLGARLVIIETSGLPDYEPARQAYLSSGYETAAVIRGFYRPGDDLYIFTKYLQPESGHSGSKRG
jgi:ribosomal protein S18 acetylase RimI-like enzyme